MVTHLSDVLSLVKRLNTQLTPPVVSAEELQQEEENLQDIRELLRSVSSLVTTIGAKLGRSGEDLTEGLIHLHLKLSDMMWHIDQIDELLIKVINPHGPDDDDR